jgi:hypothetical protein
MYFGGGILYVATRNVFLKGGFRGFCAQVFWEVLFSHWQTLLKRLSFSFELLGMVVLGNLFQ